MSVKKLYRIDEFKKMIQKLYQQEEMSEQELEFSLGCAIVILQEFDKGHDRELFELAYNIILRYAKMTKDYRPLYDISYNYGFYPTVDYITNKELIEEDGIQYAMLGYRMKKYKNEGYVETLEQNKTRKEIIKTTERNIAFIAPTSSGKSSIIVQHLQQNENIKKAIIIVPTKSLINQTNLEIRKHIRTRKVFTHDGMYNGEEAFVGVLTQERALRLLENNPTLELDCVYIDEAHNILSNEARNIILARTLRVISRRQPRTQFIFLTPFISQVNNLQVKDLREIEEQRISYNLKEPNIFYRGEDGAVEILDRFSGTTYQIGYCEDTFDYIKANEKTKNFFFLNKPRLIEQFAEDLYGNTEEIEKDKDVEEIKRILEKTVHPDFKMIKYLSHGIVYMHAKIPENIKDYMLGKFKTVPSLKYLVANVVIMEGINLPIDCLFVLRLYRMNNSAIHNLIGRVNRLNNVYDMKKNNLDGLLPDIHFVETEKYATKSPKMKNIVTKLYDSEEDDVKNPILENYSGVALSSSVITNNRKIVEQEDAYFNKPESEIDSFKRKLISSGMNQLVEVDDENVRIIYSNIRSIQRNCVYKDVIDIVRYAFITNNVKVTDKAFRRLQYDQAVSYYKHFIQDMKNCDLQTLVTKHLKYQLSRSDKRYMYVGTDFGEIKGSQVGGIVGQPVYVDVREKSLPELINLLIVKIKIEQDFLGFQYNRAVYFLHDIGVINDNQFNLEIYGTNDERIIQLLNTGIPLNLLRLFEDNMQMENLYLDDYGNLCGNAHLREYMETQNEYVKYQIDKYVFFG